MFRECDIGVMPNPVTTPLANSQFEALWTEFAAPLRQYIRTRVENEAVAEDLFQEVVVKLHARLQEVRDPARIQGWAFQIARNAIIDHYRTRKPTVELSETLEADTPDAQRAELERLLPTVRRMVEALPEPYREALLLVEFEGLTQKELAARLGISVSGAKSRVQRGRDLLKEKLLACCHFELDHRGGVIDYRPHDATRVGCADACVNC